MIHPGKSARQVILATWFFLNCSLMVSCQAPSESSVPPLDEMVVVPSGWFRMGSKDGLANSRPSHEVYLDTFDIDVFEVTESQFTRYLQATGVQAEKWEEQASTNEGDEPVVGVLWREADAYCRWNGKRLPTEAEWEKAARGTDGRRFPWGNTWDPNLANSAESNPGKPLPVGSFPGGASPYGAQDMAGNVLEWVADYYDPEYYSFSPDTNPLGPFIVLDHVLRGGSWDSPRENLQTFFRDSSHSVQPNSRVGFRCARSIDPETK